MKKTLSFLLTALLLLGVLAGCGKGPAKAVDLTAFYQTLEEKYAWGDNYMMDVTGDLVESSYPGLGALTLKQSIIKMPMISAVVNEIVLLECENDADAQKAAEILQQRVTAQAEGGAWYPDSMASWEKAQVLTQGNYVALIASAEYQSEIADAWNQLFQ